MVNNWLIVITFYIFLLSSTASGDQGCDGVFVEYNQTYKESPFYTSFNLKASQINLDTYVTVSNVTLTTNLNISGICSTVNENTTCFTDYLKGFQFLVGNASFGIYVNVKAQFNPSYLVISGVADEGIFSVANGTFYDMNQPCIGELFNSEYDRGFGQQCCTSFKPIPGVMTMPPKCTEFKSLTTVYNTNDSYSIYMNSQINYQIIKNTVRLQANYTSMKNYVIYYWANNMPLGEGEITIPLNSSLPLNPTDSKFMLRMTPYFGLDPGYLSIPVGRLLLRNGIALKEEGVPLTVQDNCQYLPNTIIPGQNKVAATQFCCSKFASA